MYPSSTSSSSQTPVGSTGLTRYVSAPGSLLTTAVDEVVGAEREFAAIGSRSIRGQYFTGDSSSITPESTCEVKPSYNGSNTTSNTPYRGLQRSYRFDETNLRDFTSASQLKNVGVVNGAGETCSYSSSSALLRQRSSPAGFLSHLNVNAHKNGASDNGFSVSRVAGSFHSSQGGDDSAHRVSRLKSQLSFSGQDSSSSSQASKISRNVDGITSDNSHLSYGTTSCFAMDAWDHSNSIVFSAPPNKRAKNYDGEIFFSTLESQFSLPQTSLEMETVERLLHIPEDSVPCKIRAKRGCATHPRSIAERERRTRISGKLKKLQDLVPNMDKQTSYADMLDLAVQHIKGLQGQVQKLQKEMENCKCG